MSMSASANVITTEPATSVDDLQVELAQAVLA